jgi:hypothetical protein
VYGVLIGGRDIQVIMEKLKHFIEYRFAATSAPNVVFNKLINSGGNFAVLMTAMWYSLK